MRAAIYARYSSEMQSEASIEDQLRICRRMVADRGWTVERVHHDMGISGASLLRPGYQNLLADARAGHFDVLVAESIDRLSRDQEHIAALHKQMVFLGIPIVTVAEGQISELHIGLKGTMSALYLKDLAQKTHRGLEGRIRKGKSAGGISYGYRTKRELREDGTFTTGERTTDPAEAAVVNRIFRDYSYGKSPRAIAAELNREGVAGPRGSAWGQSTIYGNWTRGTGILNNENYNGQLVWNRQRFIKDPITGKRQARLNPKKDWVIEEVPQLRIVEQPLWEAVKARQAATRHAVTGGDQGGHRRPENARRAKHLFSGLLKCGCCGSSYTLVNGARYGCAAARNKGTCDNRRTIEKDTLEVRVLTGLSDRLLAPDLIAAFLEEYEREYNRLMFETMAERHAQERELGQVTRKIAQIVDAIAEGMYHPSMKAKMDTLETRRAELEAVLDAAEPVQHLRLNPGLSDLYRARVAELTTALNHPELKSEAAQHLRGLLTEIRIFPESDGLAIELVGELAAIMALGANKKTPRRGSSEGSVTMVAGARYQRQLLTECIA